MRDSNFESVFIGIESPRAASLLEAKKKQNICESLVESVHTVQSYNLMVIAGMIVGFDSDDVGIFQDTFDFLQEAGIPFTTAGVLFAIEHTPLYARLEREGRLLAHDSATVQIHGSADLNFQPRQMSVEDMKRGYNWMIRALYRYDHYGERLGRALRQFAPSTDAALQNVRRLRGGPMAMTGRILAYFLLGRDGARRRFFLRTLWQILRERPSLQKLVVGLSFMTVHKHFHEYVERTHGNPESAGRISPFTETLEVARRAPAVPAHREERVLAHTARADEAAVV